MSDCNMINIEGDFQYSVNIAYDLNNENKLKSFIPTKSSLKLLEEILLSTNKTSSDRSRVLVGAYGKGKSHIVLAILSLLAGTSIKKFEKLEKKISSNEKLKILIQNYKENGTKLLPVLITGTGNNISQNFLLALQATLSENNLLDLMPETNFEAAVKTIERWRVSYPNTYAQFKKLISKNADEFVFQLRNFDNDTYKEFERIYPDLTSGSAFNPFLGFDVVEIFESVVKSLKENTAYSGVYIVYDEFSKYLETNISTATVSDTKCLQDFAEKCNRSKENQMHLMLICHKEISNYIDNLPKQKIDGWRGISERFTHIHLNNNFTQTYEIIESVILKNKKLWSEFCDLHKADFSAIVDLYGSDPIFKDIKKDELEKIFKGCFPLHPLSIYVLPRLSERVAQNERTLFTFLSASNSNGLVRWLEEKYSGFRMLSADLIYDYFEPLLKKEAYTEDLYKIYTLTTVLLSNLSTNSLEAKIVKLLSLIYILSQFERLAPTDNTIHNAFENSYSSKEIDDALKNLIEKECIVYLKRSNNFYALKQTSGIDVNSEIQKMIQKQSTKFSLKETLNSCNFDKAFYPLRYNDEREMTRYFSFVFINEDEISEDVDWNEKANVQKGDGIIYAVLLQTRNDLHCIQKKLQNLTYPNSRSLFIVPKKYVVIEKIAKEFSAVNELLKLSGDDYVLHDEYEIILNDLQEIINDFISSYTHLENQQCSFFYRNEKFTFKRKADLSEKLSKICDSEFSDTPIIINETLNKNEISATAFNARSKIISALLRNELEKNLGLTGGQELGIMRSLLLKTEIIEGISGLPNINLNPQDIYLGNVLKIIKDFIIESKPIKKSFSVLYEKLIGSENKIGMRKGTIPVYLACVFHEYRKQIVLYKGYEEIDLTTEIICEIDKYPENFSIEFMDWSENEEKFVGEILELFSGFENENEKSGNVCDCAFYAMRNWYMDLPKYAKEVKITFAGEKINPSYLQLLNDLRLARNGRKFIFSRLKNVFYNIDELSKAKRFFDSIVKNALEIFADKICELFNSENPLNETLNGWVGTLKDSVFDKVFDSGTTRFLKLCKSEGNSNLYLARQIAFISTDLNIEDWNDGTLMTSLSNIKSFKDNAEKENAKNNDNDSSFANLYEINFVTASGVKKKKIEKTKISERGKILERSLKNTVTNMGLSISENEKRQIVMELLLDLCGGE